MPLMIIPIVAAISGGAGWWAGSKTNKILLVSAALGGGYLVYKYKLGAK